MLRPHANDDVCTVDTAALLARTTCVASRLWNGTGVASCALYTRSADDMVGSFWHRPASESSLELRLETDVLSDHSPGCVQRWGEKVRLDINRMTPRADGAITSASIHALGIMRPGPDGSAHSVTVEVDQVLVYDVVGVAKLDVRTLDVDAFPAPRDELDAYEAVAGIPQECMMSIVESVFDGRTSGSCASLPTTKIHLLTHSLRSKSTLVECIDIDATGIAMVAMLGDEPVSVYAPFEHHAECMVSLRNEVEALAAA